MRNPDTDKPAIRQARLAVLFGGVLTFLAACTSFTEQTAVYLDRDLTSAGPAAIADRRNPDFKPNALPLASSMRGRRCGDVLGDTEPSPEGRVRREPLQSSIAAVTDGALRGAIRSYTFDRQMRQVSVRHDFCYEHGLSTFGKSRQDCDADFLADAHRLCPAVNRAAYLPFCYLRANITYAAVSLFGGLYSAASISKSCEYENALGPARDAVLAGRFQTATSDSLAYIRPDGSDMLTVSLGDLSQPDIRIRLSQTHLAKPPAPLPADPELWNLPLSALGLRAQDFLHYTPQVLDIDGDGIDEIVLVGLHRWSRDGFASGGLGPVFMVLNANMQPAAQVLLGTHLLPGPGTPATCGPHSFVSRWCLTEAEMVSAVEILRYSFISMPALDHPGQRLTQISFNTSNSGAITLHSYDFRRADNAILLRTTRRKQVESNWRPGTFLSDPDKSRCTPGLENYRLLQYPALRFGSQLVTWFRDRCETIGEYGVKAQPTLIGVSYDMAEDLNKDTTGKAVYIPDWPKAAIPMLPMAEDFDAAKGVWAIYLSDRPGEPNTEIIKLRIRKGSFVKPDEAIYLISPPKEGTASFPAIRPGELDGYFQYPLFSGFVRDPAHEAVASAMILFHITDQPEQSGKKPDEATSKWRLLTIAEGSTGSPAIREHSCPTPQHANLRRDREGMVTVPYRRDGESSGTSFAIVVRNRDGGLKISRIEQDRRGEWSVDGQACTMLPVQWRIEQSRLEKAIRPASAP